MKMKIWFFICFFSLAFSRFGFAEKIDWQAKYGEGLDIVPFEVRHGYLEKYGEEWYNLDIEMRKKALDEWHADKVEKMKKEEKETDEKIKEQKEKDDAKLKKRRDEEEKKKAKIREQKMKKKATTKRDKDFNKKVRKQKKLLEKLKKTNDK